MITEEELKTIENRCNATQNGPWKAYIEGRDHTAGDTFIMTGEQHSESRGEDLYFHGATTNDLDFIAHSKQDIPKLIEEIRRLNQVIKELDQKIN